MGCKVRSRHFYGVHIDTKDKNHRGVFILPLSNWSSATSRMHCEKNHDSQINTDLVLLVLLVVSLFVTNDEVI